MFSRFVFQQVLLYLLISLSINHLHAKKLYEHNLAKSATTSSNKPIKLPIEVLGKEGTIVSRSFTLNRDKVDNAKKLWIQANNLSYQNKGSIRINSGEWYPFNHESVEMQYQEKARGGMVHGGYNTIRFTIPATNLRKSDNTIDFKFDKSDGISIGYRIVKFNLLDQFGEKLLPPERFREDNPNNWKGPYNDKASIAEGKDLWYNAKLWNHYLPNKRKGFWYKIEIPSRRRIKAKCTDCHTQDGRDLELFSYSNESIIERTKFHGLSEEEGKKIASYIRSLSKEHKNIERSGRPWNPPYQPGPDVANLKVHNWQAGAGLDAVLDNDRDLLPYMFPKGISQENVYEYFDADKVEDRTTVPISMQLPDWKHWLPMIHPMDAYKTRWDDESINKLPKRHYLALRNFLENNDVDQISDTTELMSKLASMSWAYRGFHSWRSTQGEAYDDIKDDIGPEYSKTSRARLKAVKTFEIMHEFGLQDFSSKIYAKEDNVPERQWPGRLYHVFEIAPHFTSCETTSGCKTFIGQPWITGFYESTVWYELQLIIAGGHGISGANAPMDWKYHHNFIRGASSASGVHQPLRFFRSICNMYQIRNWSGATKPSKTGFQIRHQSPSWFLGVSRGLGSDFGDLKRGYFLKSLDNIEPGLTQYVLNGLLNMFLTEMDKPRNHISNFVKRNAGWDGRLDEEQATPDTDERPGFNYSYHFYRLIPEFAEMGADCQLLNRFVDWCQSAWPKWDWQPLKQEVTSTLNLKIKGPADSPTQISTVIANGGDSPRIAWFVNGTRVTEAADNQALSDDYFAPGDKVSCLVKTKIKCTKPTVRTELSAFLRIPTSKVSVTLEGTAIKESGKADAEVGDILTIRKEIDLKPLLWLDAMDIKNDGNLKDGDLVDKWTDKTGNGYDATQNDDNLKPQFKIDEKGRPSVWFGIDDKVSKLELIPSSKDDFLNKDWSIYIIGQGHKHENSKYLIGNNGGRINGFGFGFVRYNGYQDKVVIKVEKKSKENQKISFPNSFLLNVRKDSSTISNLLNGEREKPFDFITQDYTTDSPVCLGSLPNKFAINQYFKGPLYEVLIFDRTLSKIEEAYIEGYLAHKWQLNNESLMSHHPFKIHSPTYSQVSTPNGKVSWDLAAEFKKEVSSIDFGTYKVSNGDRQFKFKLIGDVNVPAGEARVQGSRVISYPNPVDNTLHVNGLKEEDRLEIIDPSGRVIYESETISEEGEEDISFENLANGIYFLMINNSGSHEVHKILKK